MSSSSDNIDYNRTASVARLHSAVARERGEQRVSDTPVSLWIVLGVAFLAISAGAYFEGNTGADSSIANRKGYIYDPQMPAGAGAGPAALTPEELHQKDIWIAQGKAVYSNCVSCHQASGAGQPGLFPHLKGSEFVIHGEKRLTAVLLRGLIGACVVDGKSFNGNMQSWEKALTPAQVAQVISYIRNEWGNSGSVVYEDQIMAAKKTVGPLATQLSEAELRAIPQDENLPPSEWVEKLAKSAATPATGPAAAPAPAPAPAPAAPAK